MGISADAPSAQSKFRAKYELDMPLLCDTDKKVANDYGVYKEKNMVGWGLERTTFVIDKNGIVRKIFPKVQVDGHTEEVLSALDAVAK